MITDCKWFNPSNEIVVMYCNELDWMISCCKFVNEEKLIDCSWFEFNELLVILMEFVWLNEFSPNVIVFNLFKSDNDNCWMEENEEWWICNSINSLNWQKSMTIGPLNELGNIFKYWRDEKDDWAIK